MHTYTQTLSLSFDGDIRQHGAHGHDVTVLLVRQCADQSTTIVTLHRQKLFNTCDVALCVGKRGNNILSYKHSIVHTWQWHTMRTHSDCWSITSKSPGLCHLLFTQSSLWRNGGKTCCYANSYMYVMHEIMSLYHPTYISTWYNYCTRCTCTGSTVLSIQAIHSHMYGQAEAITFMNSQQFLLQT